MLADREELFYVLPESKIDELESWKEVLTSVDKLIPELSRNPQVSPTAVICCSNYVMLS